MIVGRCCPIAATALPDVIAAGCRCCPASPPGSACPGFIIVRVSSDGRQGEAALRFACIVLLGEVSVITGPEEGTAAGGSHFRAAHADREHVIDLLKAAFVQGRLTKDELDARAGQALIARTYAELAALTADIPAGPPVRPPAAPARPAAEARPKSPPVWNAAIGSASCLTSPSSPSGTASASQKGKWRVRLFLLAPILAVVAAPGIIGYGDRRRSVAAEAVPQAATAATAGQGGQAPAGQRHRPTGWELSAPPAPTRPAPTCGPTGPGHHATPARPRRAAPFWLRLWFRRSITY